MYLIVLLFGILVGSVLMAKFGNIKLKMQQRYVAELIKTCDTLDASNKLMMVKLTDAQDRIYEDEREEYMRKVDSGLAAAILDWQKESVRR